MKRSTAGVQCGSPAFGGGLQAVELHEEAELRRSVSRQVVGAHGPVWVGDENDHIRSKHTRALCWPHDLWKVLGTRSDGSGKLCQHVMRRSCILGWEFTVL